MRGEIARAEAGGIAHSLNGCGRACKYLQNSKRKPCLTGIMKPRLVNVVKGIFIGPLVWSLFGALIWLGVLYPQPIPQSFLYSFASIMLPFGAVCGALVLGQIERRGQHFALCPARF